MKKNLVPLLKIGVCTILTLFLFLYAQLIQRELMVANNKGQLTLTASGKTIKQDTFYYQNISRIAINGRNIKNSNIKKNDWKTYNIEVANVFYIADSMLSMTIKQPEPIKSLSFEYQKHSQHGIIQVFLDGQLIKEVDTNSKKASSDFITISVPQHLGINKQNVFWYLLLIFFLTTSLIFITKELYLTVNRYQMTKFCLLALVALGSLSVAFTHLNSNNIYFFNSNVESYELLSLAFLSFFFSGISLLTIKAVLPTKIKHILKLPYAFIYLFPPFLAFFLIENAYSSMTLLEGDTVFYNFLILMAIYLSLSWISTSFKFGGSFLLILATSFGVLNKIMIDTRNQPILFYHFLQFTDGLNIAKSTSITFDNAILQTIFLAWIAISLLLFLPKVVYPVPKIISKHIQKLPPVLQNKIALRVINGVVALTATTLLLPYFAITVAKEANIPLNYWTMQASYAKFGSPLAIVSFYEDGLIKEPKNYSHSSVKEILDQYKAAKVKKDTLPNVIIIQNESQSDFLNLKGIQLSSDPLAFQHSLKENTIHGTLNVSVYGGGTANTEYEILTSNSLSLLSKNIFPYQQLVDGERNSLASFLSQYGYDTVALHPQSGLNYNRENVYEAFGFDKSYFLDSKPSINRLYDAKIERNFISDRSLFEGIQQLYQTKSNSPLFTFLVTMQSHGSYNNSNYDTPIAINNSSETYPDASEFLSSVQSTDEAFKQLVNYFQNYDEPTIILMYGDHQPTLNQNFYQAFMPQTLAGSPDLSDTHTTPFVIWANFNIPEQTGQTISPNFLLPYTMKLLKDSSNPLPSSAYHQFLSEVQAEVPVMTTWGYKTKDKKFHAKLDKHSLLDDYRILEYNNAIDQNTLDQYFK